MLNATSGNRSSSPTRGKQLKDEDKIAFFLNNMGNPYRAVRQPPLANEIIKTHQEIVEIQEEPPKRLKMKDASI